MVGLEYPFTGAQDAEAQQDLGLQKPAGLSLC